VLGALNIPGIMPSKIFIVFSFNHGHHGINPCRIDNTKTDRAFANIFAPGGVIFLRPAAFKKLCTLLRTLLRMIVKKKGARRLPILIKFLEKTKSIRT
jgi:hypothetical protein